MTATTLQKSKALLPVVILSLALFVVSDAFTSTASTRRAFVTAGISTAAVAPSWAASTMPKQQPTVHTTDSGIKYAITSEAPSRASRAARGDIVAIEFTGYLTNGQIFDATHSEGKSNALLFQLGSTAVIPGINELVSIMPVGQKVQAIIPASLAFGDTGVCLEKEDSGKECLIQPGSTLVYDIYLKKSSIAPP